MNIVLSFDHAGYVYAGLLTHYLENLWHTVIIVWPKTIDENDDFPDFAQLACDKIIEWWAERGILVCWTWIGMTMAANRYKEIRAVMGYNPEITKISRTHNDANVICFGARTMSEESVIESLSVFLRTDFLGGKYQRRNEKLC